MTNLKTSELLRKAADEIRRRGWWQGDFAQPNEGVLADWYENCPVCAWGAVNCALNDGDPWITHQTDLEASASFARLVAKAGGGKDVAQWNDDPGRTVDEVLDAFEKAAQAAEAEGD